MANFMANSTATLPEGRVLPSAEATQVIAEADRARGRATWGDVIRFVLVSFYLTIVLGILVATRQIPIGISFRRVMRRVFFKVRRPVLMSDISHNGGNCFTVRVDVRIPSDSESYSRVQVFEDGRPLPTAHADHRSIREKGLGRFSHWNGMIYFSSSDNTDPTKNNRKYTFKEI